MRAAALLLAALAVPAHAQWDLQTSGTTASLRGIDALGNGIAWASGSEGTVLHTTDNGAHWQRCTTPPDADKLDFRGIQAFDAQTAMVMSSGKGDLSRLYKTTDGCQTWKLIFTNPDKDGFWDALQMTFKAPWVNGMVIGDPVAGQFPIFVTTDDGTSWRRWGHQGPGWQSGCKEEKSPASKGDGLFAASNESAIFDSGPQLGTEFVAGGKSSSHFIYSDENAWDGSLCSVRFKSWKLDFSQRGSSAGPFAMAKSGTAANEIFVIVGGDYTKPNLPSDSFVVRQKFANFRLPYMVSIFRGAPIRSTTQPHGYRSAVAYDAANKTWITVGPNGTDISTDDGRNWRALKPSPGHPPDADQHWNALSLPFVVGPHGRIGILNPQALPAR